MDTIGKRITNLREQRKLTQRGLSEFINTSHTTISRIEKDLIKPSADTTEKLADFFKTTADYILYGVENKDSSNNKIYNIYSSSPLRNTFEYMDIITLIDTLTRDELIMLKGMLIAITGNKVQKQNKKII